MTRVALAFLLAACSAPPLVVDGLAVEGDAGVPVRALLLRDDPPDVVVETIGAGWAVPLGADRWLVPRHCFPPATTHVFLRDAIRAAVVRAAGSEEYSPTYAAIARDWVVFEAAGSGGVVARRPARLRPGDLLELPPGDSARLVSVQLADDAGNPLLGLVAVARGAAEHGWSGRPVSVGGVVVGVVHGAAGEHLIVLLLPAAALALAEHHAEHGPGALSWLLIPFSRQRGTMATRAASGHPFITCSSRS